MKKLNITLLLILMSSFCFAQKNIDVYNAKEYFLAFPKSWELKKSEKKDVEFFLFTAKQKVDPFRENISLMVQNVKKESTLESYIELTESQLRNMMKGVRVSENQFDRLKQRHVLVYSVNVSGASLKIKQHYYKHENKIYVLTFTALSKSYPDYINMADSVLNSFRFKRKSK